MPKYCELDCGSSFVTYGRRCTQQFKRLLLTVNILLFLLSFAVVAACYADSISTFAAGRLDDRQAAPAAAQQEKPKGPEAVARQDPNRIVAIIDGNQLTAQQAMNLLSWFGVDTRMLRQHQAELPRIVQAFFMQHYIADQAMKLHLDDKSPWKEQLQRARMVIIENHANYAHAPESALPQALQAQWHSAREQILWKAYFNHPTTKEEREALLQQEREKYKIHVQDPDFFSGAN